MNSYTTLNDSGEERNHNGDEEIFRREILQQKHYRLLNELQSMASDLPMEFQQRIPHEMLSTLASCLLDNTVFEIVKGLADIQELTENQLFKRRMQFVDCLKGKKIEMQKKHKEGVSSGSMSADKSPTLEKEFDVMMEEEIRKLDMELIMELDQIVSDQQVTLERTGVPGFHVTNKPNEIQLQRHLLNFIARLSEVENAN